MSWSICFSSHCDRIVLRTEYPYSLAYPYHPQTISFDTHMHTCIALVILTTIVWCGWATYELYLSSGSASGDRIIKRKKQNAYLCILLQVYLSCACMLELLFLTLMVFFFWGTRAGIRVIIRSWLM